jgi:pimeloyl-ACP methyl ester carboxylesterase
MSSSTESVRLPSEREQLAGALILPESGDSLPALVICHGAGEFKENYLEMGEVLAGGGLAALAIDMRGHGQSSGARYNVKIRDWVADIRVAVDFLSNHPRIDANRIGAFGMSSGGTAVLECGLIEPRLKVLVTLDATVRNSLPWFSSMLLKVLAVCGAIKKRLTGRDLRVPLLKLCSDFKMASDPDIQRKLTSDSRLLDAFMAFPLPGGAEAFFVDTIERVSRITAPALVLWGAEDTVDPPETGRLLFESLGGPKEFHVIPGNGHVGHLDRNRGQVFALTADWVLRNLPRVVTEPVCRKLPVRMKPIVIESGEAKALGRDQKWELLSPFLRQHGGQALSYATLQAGMEYFVTDYGFIAYNTVRHPVFSPRPKRIAFADPVCAAADYPRMIADFLKLDSRAVFGCISEEFAAALRDARFKVNCIGYEVELPVQTYNTKGNWKDLDLIKRARNEAKREGIVIREERIEDVDRDQLAAISTRWIGRKKVSDREIWIYARRPVFEREEDVRKFVAYDAGGRVAGFVFYDPIYRDGRVIGYSANISRCDETRFGRLATAVHMEAIEKFKLEGREVLNLNLAPFVKIESGKFNDDWGAKLFFGLSARYGNDIYNFRGLAFHKSKYRGREKYLYFASNSLLPSNDIYLAFLAADITRSYFATLGQLLRGIVAARRRGNGSTKGGL